MLRNIFLALLLSTLCLGCTPGFGKKVTVQKGEVYYKDPITKKQAKKLGDYLVKIKIFDNTSRKSVQLLKGDKVDLVLKIVVKEGIAENKTQVAVFEHVGKMINANVFPDKEMDLQLTDRYFKVKKAISLKKSSDKKKG